MHLKIPVSQLNNLVAKTWVKNYKFLFNLWKNRKNKKQSYLQFLCEIGFVLVKKKTEIFCVKLNY